MKYLIIIVLLSLHFVSFAQKQTTYCNPMNMDYGYIPIPNFTEWGKHRATADPVIAMYKGDYLSIFYQSIGLLVEQ